MKYKRARISAFLLDMLFVIFLTTMVSEVYFLNPYKYDTNDALEKYNEVYSEYYDNALTAEGEELDTLTTNLNKALYKFEKSQMFLYGYYVLFIFIYFVVFQKWNNGQTLGKKLFKVRVVNSNDENPSFLQYVLKYLLYGTSISLGFTLVALIKVILLAVGVGSTVYFYSFLGMQYFAFLLEALLVIVFLVNKEGKSFNDILAKTKVIYLEK